MTRAVPVKGEIVQALFELTKNPRGREKTNHARLEMRDNTDLL